MTSYFTLTGIREQYKERVSFNKEGFGKRERIMDPSRSTGNSGREIFRITSEYTATRASRALKSRDASNDGGFKKGEL